MSIDLSGLIEDMHINMIAGFLANIFRLHTGFIYIKLDGVNPQKLDTAIKTILGNDFDVMTRIEKDGLMIQVQPKKKK
jgi:hypothetical protein